VTRALRSGDVLLLIDGLDEISDEGDRICFVNQLRTFLATYPGVNIVVTSREAGFRVIGGALSTHCKHYKLADFDDKDIKRLTLAWHKEVVGDKRMCSPSRETRRNYM
jgi:predicted NACHT family NTPase